MALSRAKTFARPEKTPALQANRGIIQQDKGDESDNEK